MKRFYALLIIAAFALTACGRTEQPEITEPTAITTTAAPTTTTTEPTATTTAPTTTAAPAETTANPPKTISSGKVYEYNGGEFGYFERDGGIHITGYSPREGTTHLTIPQTIDGKPVISIWRGVFVNFTDLTEVILPDGLLEIDFSAFNDCNSLKKLDIPDSVRETSYGFHRREDITVTFRGKTYTYENLYRIQSLNLWKEPNPEEVAAWNETGEWDVSDILIVLLQGSAIVINSDGVVKEVKITTKYDSSQDMVIISDEGKQAIANSMNDDDIPVAINIEPIPADIIEAVRFLEPFALNVYHEILMQGDVIYLYVVVGSGENRRFLYFDEFYYFIDSAKYISFENDKVSNLYGRISEYWRTWENEYWKAWSERRNAN